MIVDFAACSFEMHLEKKYGAWLNVAMYDKCIAPNSTRRNSQYAIVALIRSSAVLGNQEL